MEPERGARAYERCARLLHEDVARPELLEQQKQLSVADQCDRHARRAACGLDLLRGVRFGPVVEQRVDLVRAHEAPDHGGQLVVLAQVVATHRTEQSPPLRRGDRRDSHEAPVARRFVAGDHDEAEGRAPAAGKVRHQRRYGQHRELHRLELRDVDQLRTTGASGPAPRRCRAQRGERAGYVLTDATADGQRRLTGMAVPRQCAGAGLQNRFGKIESVVGTTVTERRDLDDHQRSRSRAAGLRPRAEIGDARTLETERRGVGEQNDVGAVEPRHRVTRDRALRRSQVRVERAVRILRAQRIAARGFPLHHIGTEIGEELRRVRARKPARQVENPEVVVNHKRSGRRAIMTLPADRGRTARSRSHARTRAPRRAADHGTRARW